MGKKKILLILILKFQGKSWCDIKVPPLITTSRYEDMTHSTYIHVLEARTVLGIQVPFLQLERLDIVLLLGRHMAHHSQSEMSYHEC